MPRQRSFRARTMQADQYQMLREAVLESGNRISDWRIEGRAPRNHFLYTLENHVWRATKVDLTKLRRGPDDEWFARLALMRDALKAARVNMDVVHEVCRMLGKHWVTWEELCDALHLTPALTL